MIVINDSKENFMFQLEKITYECKKMINSSKEAEEFVEDCMAVLCKNEKEVKQYLDEVGVDIYGMSMEEILDQPEVFALPNNRYMILEA